MIRRGYEPPPKPTSTSITVKQKVFSHLLLLPTPPACRYTSKYFYPVDVQAIHFLLVVWSNVLSLALLSKCFDLHCVVQSKGGEVVDLLQYLCSNDVDVPVGSIIHTGLQNERGGYENDCSFTRLAENQ